MSGRDTPQGSAAFRARNPHLFGGNGSPTVKDSLIARHAVTKDGEPVAKRDQPAGPRYRSKWEAQFHEVLKARFPGAWIEHEPIRLRLAAKTTYTPDFLVVTVLPSVHAHLPPAREFTFWECKGFWRPAARVKIKVAARLYPWARFVAVVKQKDGGWKEENFNA